MRPIFVTRVALLLVVFALVSVQAVFTRPNLFKFQSLIRDRFESLTGEVTKHAEMLGIGLTGIPCDVCQNTLPLLKVVSKADCPAMFRGLCNMIGQNCPDLIVNGACNFVLPIIEKKDPAQLCASLMCAKSANPIPNLFPMKCATCTQVFGIVDNMSTDQCNNLLEGICDQNKVTCTDKMLGFACNTMLPLLQKKDANAVCNQQLKCVNNMFMHLVQNNNGKQGEPKPQQHVSEMLL